MRRYRPLRRIVGKDSAALPEDDPFLAYCREREIEMARWPRLLLDVLECGHRVAAKILPSASSTPYVHRDGEVYRKCPECPREEKDG